MLPEPVHAATVGGVAGGEVVAMLKARVEQLWHLDDLLGGGACLPPAISDLRMVGTILSRASCRVSVEAQLYSVAAAIARFAGFAAFDAGRHAAAQRLWHAGLRAAHSAGDRGEAVYLLSNLALQDIYVNRGRDSMGILDTARSNVDCAHQTVMAMLDCWQARAHAVRGERRQAAALLNRADDTYGRRRPGDDPEWIYWMPQPSLTVEAGTAMGEIGETGHAARMLTEGMRGLPGNAARDQALYLVRLAGVQLAAGEVELAISTAQGVPEMESARLSEDMDALARRFPAGMFARWGRLAAAGCAQPPA